MFTAIEIWSSLIMFNDSIILSFESSSFNCEIVEVASIRIIWVEFQISPSFAEHHEADFLICPFSYQ
jgi:hypothetical protein